MTVETDFTRPFPGKEIELKLDLLSLDPASLIFKTDADLKDGKLAPYMRASRWGTRSTDIAMMSLVTDLYSYIDPKDGLKKEAIAIVRIPGTDIFVAKSKTNAQFPEISQQRGFSLRIRDEVKSKTMRGLERIPSILKSQSEALGTEVMEEASYHREKWTLLITNPVTGGNLSMVADISRDEANPQNVLSQVEVEYKARWGQWAQGQALQQSALEDLCSFSGRLLEANSDILTNGDCPTKFEWLVKGEI